MKRSVLVCWCIALFIALTAVAHGEIYTKQDLQTLYDSLPDYSWFVDDNGNKVYYDPRGNNYIFDPNGSVHIRGNDGRVFFLDPTMNLFYNDRFGNSFVLDDTRIYLLDSSGRATHRQVADGVFEDPSGVQFSMDEQGRLRPMAYFHDWGNKGSENSPPTGIQQHQSGLNGQQQPQGGQFGFSDGRTVERKRFPRPLFTTEQEYQRIWDELVYGTQMSQDMIYTFNKAGRLVDWHVFVEALMYLNGTPEMQERVLRFWAEDRKRFDAMVEYNEANADSWIRFKSFAQTFEEYLRENTMMWEDFSVVFSPVLDEWVRASVFPREAAEYLAKMHAFTELIPMVFWLGGDEYQREYAKGYCTYIADGDRRGYQMAQDMAQRTIRSAQRSLDSTGSMGNAVQYQTIINNMNNLLGKMTENMPPPKE